MAIETTIDGLNSVTSLTAQDEVPVWDAEASGEPTKKITAQNMAASVKTLGRLVNTSEMNNALAGKQNTLTFDATPTSGSTNPVTSGGIADAIAQSTALTSYTGSNGLLVYRAGKLAQIVAFGTNATTSGTGGDIIATITDTAFRPVSRIWQASMVFDGSNYVDCNVEININGQISIRRADNAVIAGYQPQYLKLVGLTYICNGT